ncbi:hypothetical protein GCM10009681_47200 [Luedemannella helvata]|uniref:YncE family protein n=1 Tax=Luedemannella helvata TaxID=349315 RepID=A0ABN2L2A3_9ACTN
MSVGDVLVVDVADGVTAVRGARVAPALAAGVLSLDGARLFSAEAAGDDTTLHTIDTRSGSVVDTRRLAGRWVPRAGSADGRLVALTAPDGPGATAFLPAGRRRTEIVVAGADTEPVRLDLPGNLVPDAFTAGGDGLFVLDWLPATAPRHYRVRCVDLASRALTPLNTIAKVPVPPGAEEEMAGEGRLAVFNPGQSMLYTLYTHQPDHRHTRDRLAGRSTGVHAFVHSLNLIARWAYCVDLPAPFGEGTGTAHTIAADPDERSVYVLDAASGSLAVINAALLGSGTPEQPAVVSVPRSGGTAYAAAARDLLFLSGDSSVHVVRPRDGSVLATWPVAGGIRGLAASRDGSRLYVGLPDRVAVLDAATGTGLGDVAVAGLVTLRRAI